MVCNELHNKSLESISFGLLSVHLWHLNCIRVLLRNFTWLSLEKKIEYSFFVVYFVLDMRERWSCIWNPPFDKTEPNCYNSQYFGTQSKKKNFATTVYLFRVNVNKLNIRGVLKELLSFFYYGLIKLIYGDVRGPLLLTDSHVCLVAVSVLRLGEGCVAVFGIGLVRVLVHVAGLITAERVWLWLLCVFISIDMLGYKVSQQNNQEQV